MAVYVCSHDLHEKLEASNELCPLCLYMILNEYMHKCKYLEIMLGNGAMDQLEG